MTKAVVRVGLVAGCLLLVSGTRRSAAAPTVSQMLAIHPKQDGVVCTTPTPQEETLCKVEQIKSPSKGGGWLLLDPQSRPLRRFYNSRYVDDKDGTKMDLWSYYLNGVEVYREWDTDHDGRPDQYRWLNAGGMKWGIDDNQDGKIDSWKMISPEEVSQEIIQAI